MIVKVIFLIILAHIQHFRDGVQRHVLAVMLVCPVNQAQQTVVLRRLERGFLLALFPVVPCNEVKQIQQKMQIQQKRLKLRQKNLPQMKTLIQTIKKIRKINQIRIIKLIQTMKRIRLKKTKQIIKTTKIITAMQIRRIKIQKLPVSWNQQMI